MIEEMIYYPITSTLILINSAVFLYQQFHKTLYSKVGLIPRSVFYRKEYWRFITASFSHVNLFHISSNLLSLWEMRELEYIGISKYFTYVTLLAILSSYIDCFIRYHYIHTPYAITVGFSGVIFGLYSIFDLSTHKLNIAGFEIPWSILPFVDLVLTYLLVPDSSFIGHLAGIIVGYLIAFGLFDWITPVVFWSFIPWLVIFFLINYKLSFPRELQWLKMPKLHIRRRRFPRGRIIG